MKKKHSAYVILFFGLSTLCLTLYGIYKEFYAPRIGPLGSGEYNMSVYATITSSIILGVGFTVIGIIVYIQSKREE